MASGSGGPGAGSHDPSNTILRRQLDQLNLNSGKWEYECYICYNTYSTGTSASEGVDLFSCVNGHMVCSDCHLNPQISGAEGKCPTCKDASGFARYSLADLTTRIPMNPNAGPIGFKGDGTTGCAHYQRMCRIICPLTTCMQAVDCRFCHDADATKNHKINRFDVKDVECRRCGCRQKAGPKCTKCGIEFAKYYCPICNLYGDKDPGLYFHCKDCGFCRIREHAHSKYRHCTKCGICVPESFHGRCAFNSAFSNCGICGNAIHDSRLLVVMLNCGHYVHTSCWSTNVDFRCHKCDKNSV